MDGAYLANGRSRVLFIPAPPHLGSAVALPSVDGGADSDGWVGVF